MKISITLFLVIGATILLLAANNILSKINFSIHENAIINGILKYQAFAFIVALTLVFITLVITPESKTILRFGDIHNLALKETWLGIDGNSSWKKNGIQLGLIISIATCIFMFIAVKNSTGIEHFNWTFLPFILLFSLTNSFTEEMIFRFAVNGNLLSIGSRYIPLIISAVLFGLPHYQGFPNGVIGVIMAGVLGYVLSKATSETQGLGIAWVIHFLQDIIIFTAMFMMNIKS